MLLTTRPQSLDGLAVAFVDGGEPNADILLSALEQELAARVRLKSAVRVNLKAGRIEPGASMLEGLEKPQEDTIEGRSVLDALPRWCHAAIVGVGF
jgi:hypothetical protein